MDETDFSIYPNLEARRNTSMKGERNKYWNPLVETLAPEKLIELEMKNFRRHLFYAKTHSALCCEIFRNVSPEEIRNRDDLKSLPLIDKEDLRNAQKENRDNIYGKLLGIDPREVTSFRQTSGTTGKPVYVPESYESWQWRVEIWCYILWMAGFRETDQGVGPVGYNVFVAFLGG